MFVLGEVLLCSSVFCCLDICSSALSLLCSSPLSFISFHPLSLSALSFYPVSSLMSSPRLPHPLYHARFSSSHIRMTFVDKSQPLMTKIKQSSMKIYLCLYKSNPKLKHDIAQTGTTFFARKITSAKKEFAKTHLDATSHSKNQPHLGRTFPENALTYVQLTLLWCWKLSLMLM